MPVEAVVARRPWVCRRWRVRQLRLIDLLQAPGIIARDRAGLQFVEHLRVAGRVERVYEVAVVTPPTVLATRLPSPS